MSYELPPIGHALSGGVAAALANVVIYPLDMATTRVQSQSTKDSDSTQTKRQETEILPIEFKKAEQKSAGPPTSSSSTSEVSSSDVIMSEDGRKKITRTIIKTTTTTRSVVGSSPSSESLTSTSTSGSAPKVRYTSVLDAIRKTYAKEGFFALYSGLESDTFATLLSNFVYFYIYMALRQYKEHNRKSGKLSTFQELFLGAEAGIISRLFTNPIHVVTTRQQVLGKQQGSSAKGSSVFKPQQPKASATVSARSIIRDIYTQDGILGFWAGYAPTVILSINPSITYFLFETFKKTIIDRQTKAVAGSSSKSVLAAAASLTSVQIFFISAFSKAIASFLTYPLILSKTKLQAKSKDDEKEGESSEQEGGSSEQKKGFNGISDVFKTVIKDKGLPGLYIGCQGQVIKGFFSFGLMYMIKDRVVAWMLTIFLAIHKMRNRVTSS